MPMNVVYRGSADLPEVIPVFPLPGALLLPRGQMPLNIFEPRYLAMVPESKRNDAAVAAARAALEVAEQANSVGPVAELEQKVNANALDHQARFDLAVALNAKGKRQEAVDHLMEIVRRDRKWNDDGARKQLVQFFDAWGPTDEATVNGRKRLSSILFA